MTPEDHLCFNAPASADVGATQLKDMYLDLVASDLYRIRNFE